MSMEDATGVEIGTVKESELDSLLRLMCEAFSLPYVEARKIFYADPYFDLNNKLVLRVADRIVSCLTLVETSCWIGDGVVSLAGIAGVATLPSERRKGYASRLLTATVSILRERGYALTALFPSVYDFYQKLGWELIGQGNRLTVSPNRLPFFFGVSTTQAGDPGRYSRVGSAVQRER